MENDEFTFKSAFQLYRLEMAMSRVGGWDATLVEELSTDDRLAKVRDFLLGYSEINPIEHVIDCDAAPDLSGLKGFSVEEHRKDGALRFDPVEQEKEDYLYLSDRQKNDEVIGGHELRKELADKAVLNANVLEYLVKHPHLIPEMWKRRAVFFWGTIYRNLEGRLFVRCLVWLGHRWHWYLRSLDDDWLDGWPAALRAMPAGRQASSIN